MFCHFGAVEAGFTLGMATVTAVAVAVAMGSIEGVGVADGSVVGRVLTVATGSGWLLMEDGASVANALAAGRSAPVVLLSVPLVAVTESEFLDLTVKIITPEAIARAPSVPPIIPCMILLLF